MVMYCGFVIYVCVPFVLLSNKDTLYEVVRDVWKKKKLVGNIPVGVLYRKIGYSGC